MLIIKVLMSEDFDEAKGEFTDPVYYTLKLEHSLVSLSKWEARYEKPFLSSDAKTIEQTNWYIRAMALDEDVPPEVFAKLTNEQINEISTYIGAKMTATWFLESPDQKPNKEIFTAELFYYYMLSLNIPPDYRFWHLNQLLTLIKVVNKKNAPEKKLNTREAASERHALAAKRRAEHNTSG